VVESARGSVAEVRAHDNPSSSVHGIDHIAWKRSRPWKARRIDVKSASMPPTSPPLRRS
jgi:hypothetical protein